MRVLAADVDFMLHLSERMARLESREFPASRVVENQYKMCEIDQERFQQLDDITSIGEFTNKIDQQANEDVATYRTQLHAQENSSDDENSGKLKSAGLLHKKEMTALLGERSELNRTLQEHKYAVCRKGLRSLFPQGGGGWSHPQPPAPRDPSPSRSTPKKKLDSEESPHQGSTGSDDCSIDFRVVHDDESYEGTPRPSMSGQIAEDVHQLSNQQQQLSEAYSAMKKAAADLNDTIEVSRIKTTELLAQMAAKTKDLEVVRSTRITLSREHASWTSKLKVLKHRFQVRKDTVHVEEIKKLLNDPVHVYFSETTTDSKKLHTLGEPPSKNQDRKQQRSACSISAPLPHKDQNLSASAVKALERIRHLTAENISGGIKDPHVSKATASVERMTGETTASKLRKDFAAQERANSYTVRNDFITRLIDSPACSAPM